MNEPTLLRMRLPTGAIIDFYLDAHYAIRVRVPDNTSPAQLQAIGRALGHLNLAVYHRGAAISTLLETQCQIVLPEADHDP